MSFNDWMLSTKWGTIDFDFPSNRKYQYSFSKVYFQFISCGSKNKHKSLFVSLLDTLGTVAQLESTDCMFVLDWSFGDLTISLWCQLICPHVFLPHELKLGQRNDVLGHVAATVSFGSFSMSYLVISRIIEGQIQLQQKILRHPKLFFRFFFCLVDKTDRGFHWPDAIRKQFFKINTESSVKLAKIFLGFQK